VFLTLLFPYFLSNFYRPFLAVVAGELSLDIGLDSAGLASLQAVFLLSFALIQVPVALTLDRVGPRRILTMGLGAAVAGGVLLSVSTQFWHAIIAMALLGGGFSPVMMAGFYFIGRVYSPERFATLSSLLFGLGMLGDPLSGSPLALAVGSFGWRPTMLGMAACTAFSLLLVVLVLRDPPRIDAAGGRISAFDATRQVFAIRKLWFLMPVAFISYAPVAAVRGLWMAPYLERVHGYSAHDVGLAATAMGLVFALGAVLYAPLNRMLGDAKISVAAGLAVTMIAWIVLGLIDAVSGTLALTLLFIAASFGAGAALLLTHARAFLPSHLLGQGVTMINMLFFVGAAFAQWLSGRYVKASEVASIAPDLIYGRLFTAFGVVLAVALGIYLLSPRERAASQASQ
jgi:predicted MFS family arabinose efflux permease